jgi:hypothetical protein
MLPMMNSSKTRIIVFLLGHFFIYTCGSAQENWQLFTTSNSGIGTNQVEDIIIDYRGAVWVAGFSRLSCYNGLFWTDYDIPGAVRDLELRMNGNILIGSSDGLYEFNTENRTLSSHLNAGMPSGSVSSVAENYKGQIWVGYSSGTQKIAFYDGLNWSVEMSNVSTIGSEVFSIDCFGDDTWAGFGSSLVHHNGDGWEIHNQYNSPLSGGLLLEVRCDKNGKVWIGSLNGIYTQNLGRLITYDQTEWIVFDELDCDAISHGVSSIVPGDSSFWFTSYWNGFVNSNDGACTFFNETNSIIPNHYAISMATDNSNNVFMGTNGGLVIYNSDSIQIDAYKYESEFQLRPNPAREIVFLSFSIKDSQEVNVSIYSLYGEIVKQAKYNCESGRIQIEMDVSYLSKGTYLIRMEYAGRISTKRVIIT